jgi:hypothetical protein
MNRNLVGSILGRSSIEIAHLVLNEPEFCINQSFNKDPLKEIFVNEICFNRTHVYLKLEAQWAEPVSLSLEGHL